MKLGFGLIIISLVFFGFKTLTEEPEVKLIYPEKWPKPVYNFERNPLSKAKIELGRKLFYDPILSIDNTISCASCHLSYTAFTHTDHALSHGIKDSIGRRNSPVLINLAWSEKFMWDGAVNHIDVQALAPITHPAEMGEDLVHVVQKLQEHQTYPQLFEQAFGSKEITGEYLLKAIAQFQLTLVSANSKYDRFISGKESFSKQEKKGYKLFKKNCSSCHQEPLFTNGGFRNNGLSIDVVLNDLGRYEITKKGEDSLQFKVPTLRNIQFSKPYMHDGRFQTLKEVIEHYNKLHYSNYLSDELKKNPISFSEEEKIEILAFLYTLTDKEFLFNPDFAYPRKK